MYRKIIYKIEYDTTVIDFLKRKNGYSARLIAELKRIEGGITVNGELKRTIDELHQGEELRVLIPYGDTELPPANLPLEVLYEDEDVLVVNKSAFTVCHPTRNHQGDTLANAVSYYLNSKDIYCTFRTINRLDRDTTGCVAIALNKLAADKLASKVDKVYFAIVKGKIETAGTIDLPIFRPNPLNIKRCVDDRGQRAITHYEVIKGDENATLLKIALETGRTHQIRVHFSHIGHPLIGDTMYGIGDERINHQCLHCREVSFIHPITNERITVTAPFPKEWNNILACKL